MQNDAPAYYRPYSDEDDAEDADTDAGDTASDGGTSVTTENTVDPRYAIIRAAGPNFNTTADQYAYMRADYSDLETAYAPPMTTKNAQSILYRPPATATQTSLFSIMSKNRDVSVYPTAAHFALKLPRVYRNVTQIQCVQISFPFYQNAVANPSTLFSTLISYLSKTLNISTLISSCLECINVEPATTSIMFSEVGRTHPAAPTPTPLRHVITIRDGGYNSNTAAFELNRQMNKTPPLNIISYEDHRAAFIVNRTYGHLFNEPGPYLHDTATNTFKTNPTKDDIIGRYFPATHRNYLRQPTERDVFVAYYYPILKEVVLNPKLNPFLDYGRYSQQEVTNRVVNVFEGIQEQTDDIYYFLCSTNERYLSNARGLYTFEYNPIYNYEWSFNSAVKRMSVRFDRLHNSILGDITQRYSTCIGQALDAAGLNTFRFSTLQATATNNAAVLHGIYTIFNSTLTTKFGVPFGLYAMDELVDYNTIRQRQNTPTETQIILQTLSTPTTAYNFGQYIRNMAHTRPTKPTKPADYLPAFDFDDSGAAIREASTTITDASNSSVTVRGNLIVKMRDASDASIVYKVSHAKDGNTLIRMDNSRVLVLTDVASGTMMAAINGKKHGVTKNNANKFEISATPLKKKIKVSVVAATDGTTDISQQTVIEEEIEVDEEAPVLTKIGFGTITLTELLWHSQHIHEYKSTLKEVEALYDIYEVAFADRLLAANMEISRQYTVGDGVAPSFGGYTFLATNMLDYYSSYYVSVGKAYLQNTSTVNGILTCTQEGVNGYINTKYAHVLPDAIKRSTANNFITNTTAGVEFFTRERLLRASSPFEAFTGTESDCCRIVSQWLRNTYYACLPADYVTNTLAYKLGIIDPVYTNISSFIAYLQFNADINSFPTQNTYLQLNLDRSFNTMDVASNEDYAVTNDTTAQSKYVMGKILTIGQDFLGVAQTIIQNPVRFNPPLGKLDKLEFRLLLDDLTPLATFFPFDFDFTNWDAVFQIDEQVSQMDAAAMTPAPNVVITPGSLQF